MALEDNEILDRALDAAEARMIPETEAPAPDARVEEAAEVETLKEVEKQSKESRTRDASGKFLKGGKAAAAPAAEPEAEAAPDEQVSDQAPDGTEVEAEAQGEDPQGSTPIDLGPFWSADEKAAIAKAPRDVQQLVAQKEAQRTQWAHRLQVEADRGRTIEKQLWADFDSPQAIEAHKAQLGVQGIRSVGEEISRYRAWDRVFRTDPKQGIVSLLQKNGLTPYDLMNEDAGGEYPTDPRTEQALQAAEDAKRAADETRSYLERERMNAGQAQLEGFRQGKDSSGTVRAQFFDLYRPQITATFKQILEQHTGVSETDALNHAYEFVVGEARRAFGVTGAAKSQADQAQAIANAKKAKAAASSVTGAPKSGTVPQRPRAKTIDEAMDRAEEQLTRR